MRRCIKSTGCTNFNKLNHSFCLGTIYAGLSRSLVVGGSWILDITLFDCFKKLKDSNGWGHRRRIELEDKAKVVEFVCGTESLPR